MAKRSLFPWGLALFCAGLSAGLFGPKILHHPPRFSSSLTQRPKSVPPSGELDVLRIPLTDPASSFPDSDARLHPPRWFFQGFSQQGVIDFFSACGLNETQKSGFFASEWLVATNGMVCLPSDDLVRSLSGVARRKIYNTLALAPENYPQCFPFRFTQLEFESRLIEEGLPREKMKLVKSLAYTNDGIVFFADLGILSKSMPPDEFSRAVAIFYEIPTYRLRLRVHPNSEIDGIIHYWAEGGREQRITPLLKSLTALNKENGVSLNISYLLPDFCRLRLYTFPDSWPDANKAREDCFWTSMNFFNEVPDMRFLNSDFVRQTLHNDFEFIEKPSSLGDLVTLISDRGTLVHMCVFLAQDFVFTKNGMNTLQPWVIMKLSDMTAGFASEKSPKLLFLRSKSPHPQVRGGLVDLSRSSSGKK